MIGTVGPVRALAGRIQPAFRLRTSYARSLSELLQRKPPIQVAKNDFTIPGKVRIDNRILVPIEIFCTSTQACASNY